MVFTSFEKFYMKGKHIHCFIREVSEKTVAIHPVWNLNME
jgi:hypothetical protein